MQDLKFTDLLTKANKIIDNILLLKVPYWLTKHSIGSNEFAKRIDILQNKVKGQNGKFLLLMKGVR